jgi:hypothetical protein
MLAAPFAHAGDAEDKATARDLAKQGIAAEQAGDCATAIDRLERAEALFHAPIHLQHLARCYVKVGRLVEATEAYRKITMEKLQPNAPAVFKEAMDEANAEIPKLEPRLAHLTITPKEKYPDLAVTIDGKPYPSAALGISRVADPGKHVIHGAATGYAATDVPIDLPEGGTSKIDLELKADGSGGVVTSGGGNGGNGSGSNGGNGNGGGNGGNGNGNGGGNGGDGSMNDTGKPFPWKPIGIGTMAVGGVAVGIGVVTGLMAKSKFNSLQSDCPGKQCPSGYDLSSKQSSIKSLTTTTNILLVGGGVLVVVGVAEVLLSPGGKPKNPESPAVSFDFSPVPGGGHVSVAGSF